MRIRPYLFVALVFSTAFLVSGCATYKTQYDKAGITSEHRQADLEDCWKYTLSEKGQQSANLLRAARVIGGGVIALAIMAAEEHEPKKDPANIPVHNDCMSDKGYSLKAVAVSKP